MYLRYVSWLFAMSVSTFGNLRINAYLQLPAAYRSLSRPSSAPDAKAFALCSYSLELSYQWFLLESLGSLRSLNCLSFIKHFLGYFLFAVKRLFPFVHWFHFFPPFGEIVFYPTFYRKTYTNLLIFVLFVCSFFLLFNLFFFYSVFNDQSKFFQPYRVGLVGTSGLEPPTSRLSGARSNHLSYAPLWLLRYFFPQVPLVEMMGIEPMTPCLQGRCSPSWATPPLVWVSFLQFLIGYWKLNNNEILVSSALSTALPLVVFPLFGLFFAYLQIRDICEWYLTFSIERRWSSRTFRYGYLVTT